MPSYHLSPVTVPISTSLVLPKTAIGRPSSANSGDSPDSPGFFTGFPGFPQKKTHKNAQEVEFLRGNQFLGMGWGKFLPI